MAALGKCYKSLATLCLPQAGVEHGVIGSDMTHRGVEVQSYDHSAIGAVPQDRKYANTIITVHIIQNCLRQICFVSQ